MEEIYQIISNILSDFKNFKEKNICQIISNIIIFVLIISFLIYTIFDNIYFYLLFLPIYFGYNCVSSKENKYFFGIIGFCAGTLFLFNLIYKHIYLIIILISICYGCFYVSTKYEELKNKLIDTYIFNINDQ